MFRAVSWVKLVMEAGMVPLNSLEERSSALSFFQDEKSDGRGPEKLLNWRWRSVRAVRLAKSAGKVPLNLPETRLKIWRADRRLRVLGGTGPPNPMPKRRTVTTREPSAAQVTPVQLPQTAVAGLQLRS